MRYNDTWHYGGEIDVDPNATKKQIKLLPMQDRLTRVYEKVDKWQLIILN